VGISIYCQGEMLLHCSYGNVRTLEDNIGMDIGDVLALHDAPDERDEQSPIDIYYPDWTKVKAAATEALEKWRALNGEYYLVTHLSPSSISKVKDEKTAMSIFREHRAVEVKWAGSWAENYAKMGVKPLGVGMSSDGATRTAGNDIVAVMCSPEGRAYIITKYDGGFWEEWLQAVITKAEEAQKGDNVSIEVSF
jgi:hypothetical protein